MKQQRIKSALALATLAFVSANVGATETTSKDSTNERTKVRVRATHKVNGTGGRVGLRAGKRTTIRTERTAIEKVGLRAGQRVGVRASERVGARVMKGAEVRPKLDSTIAKPKIQKTDRLNQETIK